MRELTSFEEVFALAAQTLVTTAEEYGPDAVNLGLTVVRLNSLTHLLIFLGLFCFFAFCTVSIWKRAGAYIDEHFYETSNTDMTKAQGRTFLLPIICVPSTIGAVVAFIRLLNPFHIASVAGYPEVVLMKTALESAGLM